MQIMDQFGSAPGAESVRMPDGTERTLAAEHAAVGAFLKDTRIL